MSAANNPSERVIDVREIEPQFRHAIIFRLFENLMPDATLQLIAPHAPRPLHAQFEMRYGGGFQWTYLEEGPDVWRVRVGHVHAPADAR
jgi:uncharacterized protein (DUF2249 family)